MKYYTLRFTSYVTSLILIAIGWLFLSYFGIMKYAYMFGGAMAILISMLVFGKIEEQK